MPKTLTAYFIPRTLLLGTIPVIEPSTPLESNMFIEISVDRISETNCFSISDIELDGIFLMAWVEFATMFPLNSDIVYQ